MRFTGRIGNSTYPSFTGSTTPDVSPSSTHVILGNLQSNTYHINLNYLYFLFLLVLFLPISIYNLLKKNQFDTRQKAMNMAGVYKETCILNSYESNNIDMDEYFSDSSFSNDYASIASIASVSENELYLEPITKTIITKL